MNNLQKKIVTSLITAGVSLPAAFVAYNLTVPSEGFKTNVYLDPVGLKTACVGHLITKNDPKKTQYTEDECIQIFVSDWKKHQKQLDSVVKVPYASEWMYGALTDFTFNVGIGKVQSSTLLRKLNSGDYEGTCQELTKWVFASTNEGKKKLPGLVIRRTKEYQYCMGEVPYDAQAEYVKFMKEYGDVQISKAD